MSVDRRSLRRRMRRRWRRSALGTRSRHAMRYLRHHRRPVHIALLIGGRLADAQKVAEGIPAIAERAHDLTTGPAWWFAAHVPLLGDPLESVRGTTLAADRIGSTMPDLMHVVGTLNPARLRVSGDTIR